MATGRRPHGRSGAGNDRGGGASARPARAGGSLAWLAVGAALLVITIAATLLFQPHHAPAVAPAQPGPAEPREALLAAVQLAGQERFAQAIPLFRRAVDGMPGSWEPHYDLAMALANAAFEVQPRFGRLAPATRSSAERVATLAASERELGEAAALVGNAHERAVVLLARARNYQHWGLPVDALALARAASREDSAWAAPRELATSLSADLARGGVAR